MRYKGGKELQHAGGMKLCKFVAPEFVYGEDARWLVGRYARNFGARKVLIVTDPGIVAAGWVNDVTASLDDTGLNYAVFPNVSQNPITNEVMEGAALFCDEHCNLIIAVGGGSVIDCAKGIGIVSSNQRHILDFVGIDRVVVPMPPLICIPTTGGSGAEVSQFAVLRDVSRKLKTAIISKAVVPDVALVDPATLRTVTSYIAACSGFDALVHAIEAFISNACSPITDLHALRAIELVNDNMVAFVNDPTDPVAQDGMMQASLEAGLAFTNAILGTVHAMGHSLGGMYNLTHGECNAVLLSHVAFYNYDAVPERFDRIAKIMGLDLRGQPTSAKKTALFDLFLTLRQQVGLKQTLSELGVSRSDIPVLAKTAMQDCSNVTNPRRFTQRDIEVIFEDAI